VIAIASAEVLVTALISGGFRLPVPAPAHHAGF